MASVNIAVVDDMVETALSDIHFALRDRPSSNSSTTNALAAWTDSGFQKVLAALDTIVPMVLGRLKELEAAVAAQAPRPSTTTSGGATPGAPTTSTSQPAGRLPRCQKCHARGHPTSECHTTNAAAMRRRVAQNSRIARGSRAVEAAHALLPSPRPASHVPGSVATAVHIPMEYAAIAADATELRRRAAQSRRDKRLRRRASTTG